MATLSTWDHTSSHFKYNVVSKPGKALTNKHNNLNTLIEPGDITTSDHIPIILTISTEPILKKKGEAYNYNKADWEVFQSILNKSININNLHNQNILYLEEQLQNWVNTQNKLYCYLPDKTHIIT